MEFLNDIWMLTLLVLAFSLELYFLPLLPLIIGLGVSLYQRKLKPLLWGIVVYVAVSVIGTIIYLICCFTLSLPW